MTGTLHMKSGRKYVRLLDFEFDQLVNFRRTPGQQARQVGQFVEPWRVSGVQSSKW